MPKASEKELNAACTAAKSAHKASPDDGTLKAAYENAKAKFAKFQKKKLAKLAKAGGKRKRGQAAAEGGAGTWTCAVCDVTVKAEGKEQHLKGKKLGKEILADQKIRLSDILAMTKKLNTQKDAKAKDVDVLKELAIDAAKLVAASRHLCTGAKPLEKSQL